MTIALEESATPFVDPFDASANPARYVPRPATERALGALAAAVADPGATVLLIGPPGMGKTLLLRLLAQRVAPALVAVHLPYPSLPAAALFAWALDALGIPRSSDPVSGLIDHARQLAAKGRGLVLLIDDAEALPPSTTLSLFQMIDASLGALRCVAVVNDESVGKVSELWSSATSVPLFDALSERETQDYLSSHLEQAGLPPTGLDAFAGDVISELHARCEGVPARLNAEASSVLRLAIGPRTAISAAPPPSLAVAPRPQASAPPAAAAEPAPAATAATAAPAPRPAASRPVDAEMAAFERATRLLAAQHADELRAARHSARPPAPRAERAAPRRSVARSVWLGAAGLALASLAAATWLAGSREAAAPVKVSFPERSAGAAVQPAAAASERASESPIDGDAIAPVDEVIAAAPPIAHPPPPVPVQINAAPWARIFVDGEAVGITPLGGVMLTPGTHAFEAIFPDGRRVAREIEIDAQRRFVVFR